MNHLSCLGQQKKPRLSQRQWLRITCYYFPPLVWTTPCSYLSAVNHNQGKLRQPGSPSDPRRLGQRVPSVLIGAHFPIWRPAGGSALRGRGELAGDDARPGALPCRRRASPPPQRRTMPWRLGPSTAKNKARLRLAALRNRGWIDGFLLKPYFINLPPTPPTRLRTAQPGPQPCEQLQRRDRRRAGGRERGRGSAGSARHSPGRRCRRAPAGTACPRR